MNEISTKYLDRIERASKAISELYSLRQPRSNYVLEHLIVLQERTPARQRRQILDELFARFDGMNIMYEAYQLKLLDIESEKEKLIELRSNAEKAKSPVNYGVYKDITSGEWSRLVTRSELHLDTMERSLILNEIDMNGTIREVDTLFDLLSQVPETTLAELELEEPEYWKDRTLEQMYTQFMEHTKGLSTGNLQQMLWIDRKLGEKAGKEIPLTFNQFKAVGGLPLSEEDKKELEAASRIHQARIEAQKKEINNGEESTNSNNPG
jgi:hypothetical protein